MLLEFEAFQKIPRLRRDCVITEKLDGTNAQVHITEGGEGISMATTIEITATKRVKKLATALLQERQHAEMASNQLTSAINDLIDAKGHGSQVTLARLLKVTPSHLSDMRSGARKITDKVAVGLAGL